MHFILPNNPNNMQASLLILSLLSLLVLAYSSTIAPLRGQDFTTCRMIHESKCGGVKTKAILFQ